MRQKRLSKDRLSIPASNHKIQGNIKINNPLDAVRIAIHRLLHQYNRVDIWLPIDTLAFHQKQN